MARRDHLRTLERQIQAQWAAKHIFEADAVEKDHLDGAIKQKFMVTFPFPYMNGVIHLGHAFTFCKAEFQANFQRMKGKRVIWPFGFHCTGMPIQAAAQKLQRELKQYGNPPKFPQNHNENTTKITEMKAKVAAKTASVWQYETMQKMGVPENEIAEFCDPHKWLHYFAPMGMEHLIQFGASIDFRRSFITTDVNPYFDSFVRWQFRVLRAKEKVHFGNRPAIFSPADNQACADHDRSEGEGAQITEYTLIKLELQRPYPSVLSSIVQPVHKVYLPAATLRPETMPGQSNTWLLPDGEYGVYEMKNNEVFICSDRSAANMAFQHFTPEWGKVTRLGTIKGQQLMGHAVRAPYAEYDIIYILPLLTIKMDKGTGVVTSVPSDAPDDYAALMDLKNKQPMREKYGIRDEHVMPFEAVPIIETPGLGVTPAVDLCKAAKVVSQNDRQKLDDIKDKCYKEGFAKGIMLKGKYAGQPVSVVKPLIKDDMVKEGVAYSYSEPDRKVISRSGSECVVALTDQWYEVYGTEPWRSQVVHHVENSFEAYNEQAKTEYLNVLGWMHEWACSRSFGLGTRLPWDEQYVIESLSDSTIYMAYYTIAHFLQGGNIFGSAPGPLSIKPEHLTDDVWNYIFLLSDTRPTSEHISFESLDRMRNEFSFWYPMDLRVSGKDLIGNHLTMSLYNHAAVWDHRPDLWPRGFYTNGHVLVDGEKMSKSKGNFITLQQAIEEYSADATRIALADAGDSLDDANFETKGANAAILRLTKEENFLEDVVNGLSQCRTGVLNFYDRVFLNEINIVIAQTDDAYTRMLYKVALKSALFELHDMRDRYRLAVGNSGFHKDVILRYVEVSVLLIGPIVPHWSQYMWSKFGGAVRTGIEFIQRVPFPIAGPIDGLVVRQSLYHRRTAATIRDMLSTAVDLIKKRRTKLGLSVELPNDETLNSMILFIRPTYPDFYGKVLAALSKIYQCNGESDRKRVAADLKALFTNTKEYQEAMKFSQLVQDEYKLTGDAALELSLPFDEGAFVNDHMAFFLRDLPIKTWRIMHADEVTSHEVATLPMITSAAGKAMPGKPSPFFYHS